MEKFAGLAVVGDKTFSPAVRKLRFSRARLIPRVSAGLVVFARNASGEIVVAIVAHRTSYAFRDFIFGDWSSHAEAVELARSVTPAEASVLRMGNFITAAAFYFAEPVQATTARQNSLRFRKNRSRFDAFIDLPSVNLALCTASGRAETTVPRGAPNRGETYAAAAVREWEEETGVLTSAPGANFRLLDCTASEEFSAGVGADARFYHIEYICATVSSPLPMGVSSAFQAVEIASASWMPVARARALVSPKQSAIIGKFKKWVRNRHLI